MKNFNLIFIKKASFNDIKKALNQWIKLYQENLENGMSFKILKDESENYIIDIDKRLNNENFYFLINYLKYPENINYNIDIKGYTKAKKNNKIGGKELLVYMSSTDKDSDCVFVTTSDDENFKIDFGGKIIKQNSGRTFIQPKDYKTNLLETIVFNKKQPLNKVNNKNKLEKRFIILSSIILLAFVLIFVFMSSSKLFPTANKTTTFILWGWLILDYKILQSNKLYFSSVILGLSIFFYGIVLNEYFEESQKSIIAYTIIPIFMLITQRPLRLVFIHYMNREPVVKKPAPTIADFIYIFMLWMTSLTVPIIFLQN